MNAFIENNNKVLNEILESTNKMYGSALRDIIEDCSYCSENKKCESFDCKSKQTLTSLRHMIEVRRLQSAYEINVLCERIRRQNELLIGIIGELKHKVSGKLDDSLKELEKKYYN
jgi:hypothetical protein